MPWYYISCTRGIMQMILMVGKATQLIIRFRVWHLFMCCNTYIYIYFLQTWVFVCFDIIFFFMDIYTILCLCRHELCMLSLCLCICTCMLNLSYFYIGEVIQFRCMFWMMSVYMLYILCSCMLFYFMSMFLLMIV